MTPTDITARVDGRMMRLWTGPDGHVWRPAEQGRPVWLGFRSGPMPPEAQGALARALHLTPWRQL